MIWKQVEKPDNIVAAVSGSYDIEKRNYCPNWVAHKDCWLHSHCKNLGTKNGIARIIAKGREVKTFDIFSSLQSVWYLVPKPWVQNCGMIKQLGRTDFINQRNIALCLSQIVTDEKALQFNCTYNPSYNGQLLSYVR